MAPRHGMYPGLDEADDQRASYDPEVKSTPSLLATHIVFGVSESHSFRP